MSSNAFDQLLERIGDGLTATEVQDALWLADRMHSKATAPRRRPTRAQTSTISGTTTPTDLHHVRPPQSASASTAPASWHDTEIDYVNESSGEMLYVPTSSAGRQATGADRSSRVVTGTEVRAPATGALQQPLAFARALRPLKRRVPGRRLRLDEVASAEASAAATMPVPILRPETERWLDLCLVVDRGSTMALWTTAVAELRRILEWQGSFRTVLTWDVATDTERPVFTPHRGLGAVDGVAAGRDPAELIDPSGRRRILVLTDGIGAAWRSGAMAEQLDRWGKDSSVAVLHLLPSELRHRTAVRPVTVRLSRPAAGVPNHAWIVRDTAPWPQRHTQIPVFGFDPRWLRSWADLVTGSDQRWVGVMMLAKLAGAGAQRNLVDQRPGTAGERVERFFGDASLTAFRLACHLAAAPLSLPVMRLVQQTVLPESTPGHLAEVLLSGLVVRTSPVARGENPEEVVYDFADGVRMELLARLSRAEARDVLWILSKVSGRIATLFGGTLDFRALAGTRDGLTISVDARPFARVAAKVLRGLGGAYLADADRIARALGEHQVSLTAAGIPARDAGQSLGHATPRKSAQPPATPDSGDSGDRSEAAFGTWLRAALLDGLTTGTSPARGVACLIGGRAVITAGRLVRDGEPLALVLPGGTRYAATRRWVRSDSMLDVAVLDLPWPAEDVPAVPWGRMTGRSSAEHCHIVAIEAYCSPAEAKAVAGTLRRSPDGGRSYELTLSSRLPNAAIAGSPVFCGDRLVGIVSATSQKAPPALHVTPAEEILREAIAGGFLPSSLVLDSVELSRLDSPMPVRASLSPSQLVSVAVELLTEHLDAVLGPLSGWAAGSGLGIRMLVGHSLWSDRVVNALAQRQRGAGWAMVRLRLDELPAAQDRIIDSAVPVLVIVDSLGGGDEGALARFVDAAAREIDEAPIRLLILVPHAGPLRDSLRRTARDLPTSIDVDVVERPSSSSASGPVVDTAAIRSLLCRQLSNVAGLGAVDWSAVAARVPMPGAEHVSVPVADRIASMLADLLDAGAPFAVTREADVPSRLLAHEARWWGETGGHAVRGLHLNAVPKALAIAILCGFSSSREAATTIQRLDWIGSTSSDSWRTLTEYLWRTYDMQEEHPSARPARFVPRLPGLVIHRLLAQELSADQELMFRLFGDSSPSQREYICGVLSDAALYEPRLRALAELLT